MRHSIKRHRSIALSALAAAGLSAWAGVPAARGDFVVSVFNMGVQSYGGNTWQTWVLAATNNGNNGTGSTLDVVGAVIDTGGTAALGIDIEKTGGTGTNTKYIANVNGTGLDANGINATLQSQPAPPIFGDIVGGTFVGVGTGQFSTDLANHPVITQAANISPSSSPLTVVVNGHIAVFMGTVSQLDPDFKNIIPPVINIGNIDNGSVDKLEVDVVAEDSSGNAIGIPDDAANGPVPFANIVVPAGTAFTVTATLGGESGSVQHLSVALPEPTGISSIALGGLALLKRRRKPLAG